MANQLMRIRRLKKALVPSFLVVVSMSVLTACTSEEQKLIEHGQVIYTGTCKVCHAQGINGAPILGNNKMWSKRTGQGIDVLVQHASEGYGLMPAKGGNTDLTSDDLRAAISFMLSKLEE